MKLLRDGRHKKVLEGSVVTLGNFDGVHLGHMRILTRLLGRARLLRVPAVVYTFEPHPLKIVAPHRSLQLLLDVMDKVRLLKETGIDCLVLARFTKGFAAKHPREFVEDELVANRVGEVWVGHDFSFGHGRTGTVEYLKELGTEFGFKVVVAPAHKRGGAVVSSSRIRGLIKAGEVAAAAVLLGRRYSIRGRVVRGRKVGKGLGFPTANISVMSELLPGDGVYAGFAVVDGNRHKAAINVGSAPTFGVDGTRVEAHLLDFKGSIYGKRVEVIFVKRLRDVTNFASTEALVSQIGHDVKKARVALGKVKA